MGERVGDAAAAMHDGRPAVPDAVGRPPGPDRGRIAATARMAKAAGAGRRPQGGAGWGEA
jgi:hypothetical protein